MLKRAVSGQFVYFDLVSAISGNAVTGASGSISGRKATDDVSGMIVLSGNIIELGGGMYRANLYDFDTSGLYIGYYFTASGCVPRSFSIVTVDSTSGRLFLSSGQAVSVNSGQLSGQQVNLLSGNQTQVWSGTQVNVFSGQLSGQAVNLLSGNQTQVWSGTFVNVFSGQLSGQPMTAPASGTVYLASGHQAALYSGQSALVYSGQLSGQLVNLLSGNQVGVWSGTQVNLFSGQLSGQQVTARTVNDKSGYTLHSSGLDPILIESGLNARQALAIIGASVAGRLSGAGTANLAFDAMGVSGELRIAATVTSSGNRTVVTLTPPG